MSATETPLKPEQQETSWARQEASWALISTSPEAFATPSSSSSARFESADRGVRWQCWWLTTLDEQVLICC